MWVYDILVLGTLGPLDLGTLRPWDSWTSSLLQHLLMLPLTSFYFLPSLRLTILLWNGLVMGGGWIVTLKTSEKLTWTRPGHNLDLTWNRPGPELDNSSMIFFHICQFSQLTLSVVEPVKTQFSWSTWFRMSPIMSRQTGTGWQMSSMTVAVTICGVQGEEWMVVGGCNFIPKLHIYLHHVWIRKKL